MATSGAFTSAGTDISISSALPATYDATAFGALTWVSIGEVTELGEFGRVYNIVKLNLLKDRRTVKRKGSYDDGTIAAQMARVPDDAGQTILVAAVNSDNSYSVKVTLQDGTKFYFSAQISSYTTNVGNVDQITAATVNFEIDNDIIEVAAP